MKTKSPSYGFCYHCRRLIRLTKKGVCYRHGFKFITCNKTWLGFVLEAGYHHRYTRGDCPGSGKPPSDRQSGREWSEKQYRLRERLKGQHWTDEDVNEIIDEGEYDEEEILMALSVLGHTIGRTKDGRNEWWPKDDRMNIPTEKMSERGYRPLRPEERVEAGDMIEWVTGICTDIVEGSEFVGLHAKSIGPKLFRKEET